MVFFLTNHILQANNMLQDEIINFSLSIGGAKSAVKNKTRGVMVLLPNKTMNPAKTFPMNTLRKK